MVGAFWFTLFGKLLICLFKSEFQSIVGLDPESKNAAGRPHFDDVELCCGWRVTGRNVDKDDGARNKQIVTKWVERTTEEAFNDVSIIARDLASSLQNQMDVCLKTDSRNSNFFDIEETVLLICRERVLGERVKLNEGDLEVFGAESFKDFFWEVCHLKHIRDDDRFDARLYQSVLRDWKGAVRFLVWDQNMKDQLLTCLIPAEDGDVKLINEIKM